MSAESIYMSKGAHIDHHIRAKGYFCLVNLEGTKVIVYGMGKPVPEMMWKGLNENKGTKGAALMQFLINQARLAE